ncbi:5080_t:CDS:2 [Paraglomus brasilianum]|uniref:5080_t:CDS:1 n=1 Tax=Paraglomus brasilianum TaxID=144538 RepID=A0A9N9BIC5_9GLOM|nr:5080_t:CDS:2 [Paraglomus brasilianum]
MDAYSYPPTHPPPTQPEMSHIRQSNNFPEMYPTEHTDNDNSDAYSGVVATNPYNNDNARFSTSTSSLDSNDRLYPFPDTPSASTNALNTQPPGSKPGDDSDEQLADLNTDGKQPRSFFRNRRKACCFICCGVVVIIAAILIPLAIYVIAPAIAQGAVTGSKLQFSSAKLSNLTEDSFVMTVSGKVTDTGPMAATIDVPDGVVVTWEGMTLGRLPLDRISAAPFAGANIESSQVFAVTNKTAFEQFNKFMLTQQDFTWHLEGSANVKAAGLSLSGIQLSKDVTMKGMDNFPSVTIKSFNAPSDHPSGGIAIVIDSNLVNVSPVGVELGDLFFDVLYLNQTIGEVSATNITLVTGDNPLKLSGRLIPQNTTAGLAAVSDMFSKYIAGDNATTTVVAKLVKPSDGGDPISWLQNAFQGTRMDVVLEGGKNLTIISGVTLNTMDLVFAADSAYSPTASSSSLGASFSIPFGFPLKMKQISQNITIFGGGKALADLNTPYAAAQGDSTSGQLTSSIAPVPLVVVPGSEGAFNDFSQHLTTDSSVAMLMKGTASSIAGTSIGDVEIKGIKLSVQSSLTGLQGLQTKPVVINSLSVTGGTTDHMIIQLSVTMFSPSNVKITMGDISFDLFFQGKLIGQVLMNNFTLDRGVNTRQTITNFAPQGADAIAAGRTLLDNFILGKTNTVAIQGSTKSTSIASLQQALATLKLSAELPGLQTDKPIIVKARFAISLGTLFSQKGTASIDAFNPLDTAMKFLHIKASITFKGTVIGTMDQDLTGDPVVIPAKQVVTTQDFVLNLNIGPAAIDSLFKSIAGDLVTDITSEITVAIGDYQTTLDYAQNNVPTGLGK